MDVSWLSLINTAGIVIVAILAYLGNKKTQEVHFLVNSRLTELLELTERSAHAAGVLSAKEQKEKVCRDTGA